MADLRETAATLVAPGKGILAADESITTMSARLQAAGVEPTAAARRDYRHLLLTTPGLQARVSGIILCDETFGQDLRDGTPFPAAARDRGILPGIKVDTGTTPLPFTGGGLVTQGLDGLRERLRDYRDRGAAFAKWRAVVGPADAGRRVTQANVQALARYAALCQEAGVVPIVEPEFLMTGAHGIAVCQTVTASVLKALFDELHVAGVDPGAVVLKPNMVVAGAACPDQPDPAEVARRTLAVLNASVPHAVPGIAFLSGGQPTQRACANLRAINDRAQELGGAPWRLTFSFGRALVDDALRAWGGTDDGVTAAQQALAAACRQAAAATDLLTAWYPDLVEQP
jgi:fructose-bisphosphate aldolase class I